MEAKEIDNAIKDIIRKLAPNISYISKYGGEVLAPDPNDTSKFVGGIFAYENHVSLEFSNGATFDDPQGHLEGKGKNRRHLKFITLSDVEAKDANSFLEQAFAT